MAQIHNSELLKGMQDSAKLQTIRDRIPDQLADKIVPVMEVNPKLLRVCNIVRGANKATTASATLYTTPTDKDFYLTGIALSYTKNVTCDTATGALNVTVYIDGALQTLFSLAKLTLTAEEKTGSITFPIPVKLDRNTPITYGTTWTAGAMIQAISIVGYTVDNVNA